MSTFNWTDENVKDFVTDLLRNGYYDIPKHLADFKASKQHLFTTEDGVAYYVGEKKPIYCLHTKDGYNSVGAWHIDVHPEYYDGIKTHYEHFFSTKEKAKEYCQWHKPLFSLQEIKEAGRVNENNPYFRNLIEKAKEKLNLK